MSALLRAVRLLLPPWPHLLGYWGVALGLLVAVQWGLEPAGPDAARLWGLPLVHFGVSAPEIMRNVYREMSDHVWVLVALPFACFGGLGPLMRTFRGDFRQFLSSSRRPRWFIEAARLLALLVVVVAVSLPFAVGGLWCSWQPWFRWPVLWDGLAACFGLLLFACVLVYALAALGLPSEVAAAAGVVVPFLLTGAAVVLEGSYPQPGLPIPAGLPHSVDSSADPKLRAALVLAGVAVAARGAFTLRTRWLVPPKKSVRALTGHEP